MTTRSYLGLALAYRRIGAVVLKGGALAHWEIARAAYDTLDKLTALVATLVAEHDPQVIVLEQIGDGCRKSEESQRRIAAMAELAKERGRIVMSMPRRHGFKNKYEEAEALVARYPDLAPRQPKPVRCWENEPRDLILFEALAMADSAMRAAAAQ